MRDPKSKDDYTRLALAVKTKYSFGELCEIFISSLKEKTQNNDLIKNLEECVKDAKKAQKKRNYFIHNLYTENPNKIYRFKVKNNEIRFVEISCEQIECLAEELYSIAERLEQILNRKVLEQIDVEQIDTSLTRIEEKLDIMLKHFGLPIPFV